MDVSPWNLGISKEIWVDTLLELRCLSEKSVITHWYLPKTVWDNVVFEPESELTSNPWLPDLAHSLLKLKFIKDKLFSSITHREVTPVKELTHVEWSK